MSFGSSTGEQYDDEVQHALTRAGLVPKEENNSPTGSATSSGGTVEALNTKNPGPILPAGPPPFSSPPLQPGPTWNQLPPGAKPGEKLSDAVDEVKAGQQYAMEERRKPLSELPSGAGRGEGGAGGTSAKKLKLDRVEDSAHSEAPGQENFMIMSGKDHIGGISITPEKFQGGQILHTDFVYGRQLGSTPTQRAQSALEIRKALQEAYPDALGIYGYRVSGSKGGKKDPYQFIPLKDEYSGKDLKAIMERERPHMFYRPE